MTGFSGVINDLNQDLEELTDSLVWLGSEQFFNFEDENLKISISLHDTNEDDPPAEANDGDVLIWVWGEIYGHDDGKEYTAKHKEYPDLSDSEYCAKLYERYGIEFVEGLNSNFAGIVYERDENLITFFTDRLSARPIFYAKPTDDSLVFSTSLQSIANHHSLDLGFDRHGLYDFFKCGIVYGLKTVLKGVKQLHPGSFMRYDLSSNESTRHIYWRPKYEPKRKSYDDFVDEFYRLFKQIYSEYTSKDRDYGLLLSGGSDSRLIASLADEDTICYHMNENMNKEAETAKQVADTLNLEFEFLKRDIDYYPSVLERTSSISNLNNWFDQAHTGGFLQELRKKSECIINGSYADTLLGDRIPTLDVTLPIVSKIHLPFLNSYSKLSSFNNDGRFSRNKTLPSYLHNIKDGFSSQFNENTDKNNVFHGIYHKSLEDLLMGGYYYYPLTNTFSFFSYFTLVQTTPVCYPFIDNRMINFVLKSPVKYLLRKDIVKSTLCKYDRDLANIPHPKSGLTMCDPEFMHWFSRDFPNFMQKLRYSSFVDANPWPNHADIIRRSDFVEVKLKEHSDIIEKCDLISKQEAWNIYEKHLEGNNHYRDIYALLTFIENPISEKIIL